MDIGSLFVDALQGGLGNPAAFLAALAPVLWLAERRMRSERAHAMAAWRRVEVTI